MIAFAMQEVRSKLLAGFFVFSASCCSLAAADKNGLSLSAISTPSGPGSLEGLGEAFQPSLNSGTGKSSLNIKVPPGTAGHAPDISFYYEGGDGNGVLGFGWGLPSAYVQLQTEKGVPKYDGSDRFINESREELVPVSNGPLIDFFCENEGAFIRYRRVQDHWEGRFPDGIRMVFGESVSARIHDPEDPERAFRWLVERVIDRNGNEIHYDYESYAEPAGQRTGGPTELDTNSGQKYLRSVTYGPGGGPWEKAFHFIDFRYEDRLDWFEDCRGGFCVRTGKRLVEVVVGTQGAELPGHLKGDFNADGQPDFLNRRYRIGYVPEAPVSLIRSVTEVGADDATELPPRSYEYTLCRETPDIDASNAVVRSSGEPSRVFDRDDVEFTDMNGDGLPDLLRTASNNHVVAYNSGEAQDASGGRSIRWSDERQVGMSPGPPARNLSLGQEEVVLNDMDGDGLADLVHMGAFDTYYYRNISEGGNQGKWGPQILLATGNQLPPSPFRSGGQSRTLDLDFDKRIDVIQSTGQSPRASYNIWYNRGAAGYKRESSVSPSTGYDLSQSRVHVADVNGDRLSDLVWIHSTQLRFTISIGRGRFLSEATLEIPDIGLSELEMNRATLQDINGDGLADLVVVEPRPGQLWYWPNRGNRTLGSRIRFTGLPRGFSASASVRWVDLNGNGTSDYVVGDSSASGGSRIRSVDLGRLTGCVPRPYLLRRMSNGLGRVEELIYTTSTEFVLEDGTDAEDLYEYGWPHALPFPVTVIKEVRTSDSLGDTYVTQFKYHDGYYDAEEKQFRGFGRVEQIDVGDETSPTLVSVSHFDVGAEREVLKGKRLRIVAQDEDGGVFSDESTDWQVTTLRDGVDERKVDFAYPAMATTEVLERGQGEPKTTRIEFEYDSFGNVLEERNYGIVEGENVAVGADERLITYTYAINQAAWLLRFPYETVVRNVDGTPISRSRMFYDDPTHGGENGGLVTKGNLTLEKQWVDASSWNGDYIKAARQTYDEFGNVIASFDPLYVAPGKGHWQELGYDPVFRTYPVREVIHVDGRVAELVALGEYDLGFGSVLATTDFNGNTTTMGYDPLNRITEIVKPLDSPQFPTAEFSYLLALPVGEDGFVNYIETRLREEREGGQLISRQFFDGLGRLRQEKKEDEVPGQYIVSNLQSFNQRRNVRQLYNPFVSESFEFESLSTEVPYLSTEYDPLGRATKVINQDGTFSSKVYQPFYVLSYDENDNSTEPNARHAGTPMGHAYDGLGRLVRVDERIRVAEGDSEEPKLQTWETHYTYRSNDKLLTIVDSQKNLKTYEYDGLGRLTGLDDPNRGRMDYTFDSASNLVKSVDHKGQVILQTYDGVNRLITEDYLDEGTPTSYGFLYDPLKPISPDNRPDVAYFYDVSQTDLDLGDGTKGRGVQVMGRLSHVWDLSGEEHFSYDERGRTSWQVKRLPDMELEHILVSYQTSYSFDSLDRMTRLGYPDGDYVRYAYNDRGLVERIFGDIVGDLIGKIEYSPWEESARCEYGSGVVTTRTFDKRMRLRSLVTSRPSGEGLIDNLYELDPSSNILQILDRRRLPSRQAEVFKFNTQRFLYDDLYRLVRVDYPKPTGVVTDWINYHYDRIGNMTIKRASVPAFGFGRFSRLLGRFQYGGSWDDGARGKSGRGSSPAGPHALSQVEGPHLTTLEYDRNGNMVRLGSLRALWDFRDRMIRVIDGGTTGEYVYDFQGRRVIKATKDGELLHRFSHYVNRHFEVRPGDRLLKFIWLGNKRVARSEGALSTEFGRIQRLRLHQGWNLVSVSVSGSWGAAENSLDSSELVVFAWDLEAEDWLLLNTAVLPSHTPLWVRSSQDIMVAYRGTFQVAEWLGPEDTLSGFVSNQFLELWSQANKEESYPIWAYDPIAGRWHSLKAESMQNRETIYGPFQINKASFAKMPRPFNEELVEPECAKTVYYHLDHGLSVDAVSSCEEDSESNFLYFPFGAERLQFSELSESSHYGYSQKEKDRAGGFHYFEARFSFSEAGRFLSVDPIAKDPTQLSLLDPQIGCGYSYCRNNPLRYTDPSGAVVLDLLVRKGIEKGIEFGMSEGVAFTAGAVVSVAAGSEAGDVGKDALFATTVGGTFDEEVSFGRKLFNWGVAGVGLAISLPAGLTLAGGVAIVNTYETVSKREIRQLISGVEQDYSKMRQRLISEERRAWEEAGRYYQKMKETDSELYPRTREALEKLGDDAFLRSSEIGKYLRSIPEEIKIEIDD